MNESLYEHGLILNKCVYLKKIYDELKDYDGNDEMYAYLSLEKQAMIRFNRENMMIIISKYIVENKKRVSLDYRIMVKYGFICNTPYISIYEYDDINIIGGPYRYLFDICIDGNVLNNNEKYKYLNDLNIIYNIYDNIRGSYIYRIINDLKNVFKYYKYLSPYSSAKKRLEILKKYNMQNFGEFNINNVFIKSNLKSYKEISFKLTSNGESLYLNFSTNDDEDEYSLAVTLEDNTLLIGCKSNNDDDVGMYINNIDYTNIVYLYDIIYNLERILRNIYSDYLDDAMSDNKDIASIVNKFFNINKESEK